MYLRLLAICVAALAAAPITASAADKPEAQALARTRALIDVFLEVQKPPSSGALSSAQKAANCDAYQRIDRFFAFDTMIERALAPRRDKFSTAQLRTVKNEFRELIRLKAYPGSGNFFRDADYKIDPPMSDGAQVDVPMRVYEPDKDWTTDVTYHWVRQDGDWVIVDASFDGDSLLKDYQNQFSRIIDQEGVSGFMERLGNKLAEARKGAHSCP